MANNFLDNVVYVGSTLAISGDALAIGSTDVGAKSIIFSNSTNAGHLAWNPSAVRTVNIPDAGGTLMLTSQAILSVFAGTTRVTSGELSFANGNNISFGINGQTITGSVAAGGGGVVVQAGTQTGTSGTIIFSNSNGISFGMAGSATVTASYTVPSTAGLISAVNVSAGTTSSNVVSVVFSNSNNFSFGMNGATVTGSYTVPTQTNQTEGLYAIGNTTGQSSSSTFDARTFSISGAGIASVGYSGNALVISVPTGAPSPVNFSAGTTSSNLGSVVFSNSNGISFGLNGATITGSVVAGGGGTLSMFALGNTTQNSSSSIDARSISFNALGAMTMGYSNGSIQVSAPPVSSLSATGGVSISTNGSTISIGASQIGTVYDYEVIPVIVGTVASTVISANTASSGAASFFPFAIPIYLAGGFINLVQSISFISTTASGRQTISHSYALYTRGTGTNNTTMGTITSGVYSIAISQSNSTFTINQPTTTNATGYGTGSTTSAGVNITSGYTGMKLVQFPLNSTLSPGNYWLGLFVAASTSSANCGISNSYIGVQVGTTNTGSIAFNRLAPIGSFSSAFTTGTNIPLNIGGNWYMGQGSFTSAAQTNLPASVAFSAITQDGISRPFLRINSNP